MRFLKRKFFFSKISIIEPFDFEPNEPLISKCQQDEKEIVFSLWWWLITMFFFGQYYKQ